MPSEVWYALSRAGLVVSILLVASSALLLLSFGVSATVIYLGIGAMLIGVMGIATAYEAEKRDMLEQGAAELQKSLGFRITKTRDGSQVVFVDPEGNATATQPAAPWAFMLWEKARELQLTVGRQNAKAGEGKTEVQHHDDGTIEIKTQGDRL